MKQLLAVMLSVGFMPAIGCSSHATATAPATGNNAAYAAVGSAAPAFDARGLDGKPMGSADFAGKILVLNFWATWCPPCRRETPDMISAYTHLNAPDVAFLGVDTTETAPVVQSFVALKSVPYAVALAGPQVYNGFGIAFIPTTIVVDSRGIVRARWVGGITPKTLGSLIASARAGKNSTFETPQQQKIDALLDVSTFHYAGGHSGVVAAVARANKRLDEFGAYEAKLDASPTLRYDDERTTREQGAFTLAAADALSRVARSPKEKRQALMMCGAAYGLLNRWADAAGLYRVALSKSPKDPALHAVLTDAYYRLHDYPAMAAAARSWIAVASRDPAAWDDLGKAYQRMQRFKEAVPPYETTLALLRNVAAKQPIGKNGDAVTAVADESMDLADVYVSLGDAKNARKTFDQAVKYGQMIPPKSAYADMRDRTRDRAVEGMAAVALAQGSHKTAISLTKWTGADLPGSVASTFKYRLVVVAAPNHSVTLATKGLGKNWVASFCADRLCSPNTVTFVAPATGVKSYEFQLVPPTPGAAPGRVLVGANDADWTPTPSG